MPIFTFRFSILNYFLLIGFWCTSAYAQPDVPEALNLGFESRIMKQLPDGWKQWGMDNYVLTVDSLTKYSGRYALRIEAADTANTDGFGCCVYTLQVPATGENLELSAAMKLQGVASPAGLMLRVDDETGKLLTVENMMQKDVAGTRDWAIYSVTVALPPGAHTITIGALLTGTGVLWVDHFQLKADGEVIMHQVPTVKAKYPAEKDHTFDNGSQINISQITPKMVENLSVLCRVWGFVKYHHAAVAEGRYNMDYELLRLLPDILDASLSKRNKLLAAWLQGVESSQPAEKNTSIEQMGMLPDNAWIYQKEILGKTLSEQLQQIITAKRSFTNYYIRMDQHVGNPVFLNEQAYPEMLYPDVGFRLLALFRYWNIVQYYYPYKSSIENGWLSVLQTMIPRFITAKDILAYQLAVSELIAYTGDAQARLHGTDKTLPEYQGVNYAPFEIDFVEGKAVVTGYFDPDLGKQSGLKPGDIIELVNQVPVTELINAELPYTPASNLPGKLSFLADNLLRTNETKLQITYQRNGNTQTRDIGAYPPSKARVYLRYTKERPDYRLLPGDIAYIYAGRLKNERLSEMMQIFGDTQKMIIDLRCYLADNITFTLAGYLMPQATEFAKFTIPDPEYPGHFYFTDAMSAGKKRSKPYKGSVVILVNEQTLGSAEFAAMAFRVAPHAVVIGSTTSGAGGNVSKVALPGGLETYITGIGLYYPDGRKTHGVGIIPDITVSPSIQGITEGRDEVLEKAMEH